MIAKTAMADMSKQYDGIMVSSTFTDLASLRQVVIDAIKKFDFMPVVMEDNGARVDADVIESSLNFVRDAAAYIAIIGHRYGQTPIEPTLNPDGLSITELEFNEAQKLGLPTLLFVMGNGYSVLPEHVEKTSAKRKKLKAFLDNAKKARAGSAVERVYTSFSSKEEFTREVFAAVGKLAIYFSKRERIDTLAAGAAANISTEKLHEEFDRIIEVDAEATADQIFDLVRDNIAARDRQIKELGAVAATDNRIKLHQKAAEQALRKADDPAAIAALLEAEAAITERRQEDARSFAKLATLRAEALLRTFNWRNAARAWEAAADSIETFDNAAAESVLWNAADALQTHGETFGKADPLDEAIRLWKVLGSLALSREDANRTASIQNNLGIALHTQGQRTAGKAGLELIADAVKAFRAALTAYTEEIMPKKWAMIQNNLGAALEAQSERASGVAKPALLADAVAAYHAALAIRTEQAMPVEWAMTQNNLGGALRKQGERNRGRAGLKLLADAVAAYKAALTVRTEQAMPADWAMTQNNLGNALSMQGERTDDGGLKLLIGAVTAYKAALTVHTERAMPVKWANTMENLALVLETMADTGDNVASNLGEAELALLDALRVYTPEHMSYDYSTATAALARIRTKIAALPA